MFHLITGGSGSGKSAYAEEEILRLGPGKRFYIATMQAFDAESKKRIERHRNMRSGKGFETIECQVHLERVDRIGGAHVLLECMSNLVANEMYREDGAKENTVAAVTEAVSALAVRTKNLVVVTNEIFSDIWPYDEETRRYQLYLGEINCCLAQLADRVTEVVCGIPILVKGEQKP